MYESSQILHVSYATLASLTQFMHTHMTTKSCDIAEDVAIAYGYNNIPRTIPATNTVGKQQPMNKISDCK